MVHAFDKLYIAFGMRATALNSTRCEDSKQQVLGWAREQMSPDGKVCCRFPCRRAAFD